MRRRDFHRLAACALATATGSAFSQAPAQPFPQRPIQLLIPYPAGGTTDVMARALQEPLHKALGQPIVVENKPGAAGVLAAREVARAKPDGHSLLFINSGIVSVTPHLQKDAGYDGVKDFAPVALMTVAPLFVIVPGSLPVNDLRGFVEWARAQPHPIAYGSAGVGSFGHLASELFAKTAGLRTTHVPYRGQAPTTQAVLSGEIPLLITSMSSAMRAALDAGKLKLLAVTSAEPSPLAPGVPIASSTLPGYVAETWFGLVTARGTPAPVVARLNAEVNAIMATRDMQERMAALGQRVQAADPAQLGRMIAEDSARWGQVIRDNNINAL